MLATGVALAFAAAAAFAAPGGGYGPGGGGHGPGYGMGNGACATGTAGADCPRGPGHPGRMGRGMGSGPGGQGALMTEEERAEHREKMHSFTTIDQCNAYWVEHRAEMTARAQARGVEPGPGPRGSPCERMAARGVLKPAP